MGFLPQNFPLLGLSSSEYILVPEKPYPFFKRALIDLVRYI